MESDSSDLIKAESIVRRVLNEEGMDGLPGCWVRVEPYIHYNDRIGEWMMVGDDLAKREARSGNGWVHQPDILVRFPDTAEPIRSSFVSAEGVKMTTFRKLDHMIVEIDGSIHDKKVKDTIARNKDYERAHIPHIVINKSDAETCNVDWGEELYGMLIDHVGGMFEEGAEFQ